MIPDNLNEEDLIFLENETRKAIEDGCKECNYRYIIYSTNISVEPNGSKVFFIEVDCPSCKCDYKEIMGVR